MAVEIQIDDTLRSRTAVQQKSIGCCRSRRLRRFTARRIGLLRFLREISGN